MNKLDWQGVPITEPESPDAIIKVWEITPHGDRDFDACVERDYHKATEYASRVLEQRMEAIDVVTGEVATVSVRLVEMTVEDYEIAVAGDMVDMDEVVTMKGCE